MRLLLTSAGIANESMRTAVTDLLDRPFGAATVVFISTAATAQSGNHGWLVSDINQVYALGWNEFNVLDINGLPRQMVVDRLNQADAIYATGGNAYHLARSITDNGLADDFMDLLRRKVYVGASAGSMIFTRQFSQRLIGAYGVDDVLYQLRGGEPVSPFDFYDWWIHPHARFDAENQAVQLERPYPLFALDDQSAVRVIDDQVDVVSEGRWLLIG